MKKLRMSICEKIVMKGKNCNQICNQLAKAGLNQRSNLRQQNCVPSVISVECPSVYKVMTI